MERALTPGAGDAGAGWIRVPPWLPAALFAPAALAAFGRDLLASTPGARAGVWMALALAGLLLWTLAEYILHRWGFHHEPSTGPGRRLHWLVHGYHHAHPDDGGRLVVSPWASVPVALAAYLSLTAALGAAGRPLLAGFLLGYVTYDGLHWAIHHRALRGTGVGPWLRAHHLRHHFADDTAGFGVTTPLWDWVCGTLRGSGHRAPTTRRGRVGNRGCVGRP